MLEVYYVAAVYNIVNLCACELLSVQLVHHSKYGLWKIN